MLFSQRQKVVLTLAIRNCTMYFVQLRIAKVKTTFCLCENSTSDSSYFLDSSRFNETMRAISKEYSKSKEEFVLHFKRTYSEPYPPSWIFWGELLTIGNVNAIYRNIKQNRIRKRIAKRFGLPINHGLQLLLLLEMPVVIIQEYGTNRMLFSQRFQIVLKEWITLPTDSMRAYFSISSSSTFLMLYPPIMICNPK